MTGKVIAVANMKGGVGKTATVVGLAEALAAGGSETLVIDLDPQANASICIAGSSVLKALINGGHTIDGFLDDLLFRKRDITFDDCVRRSVSNVSHAGNPIPLSLLASSSRLRLLERELVFKLTRARHDIEWIVDKVHTIVGDQLKRTRRRYEYVVIDCPPGISILTEASVRLADMVVVPTIPDFLSTYGLLSFCSNLWTGELAEQPAGTVRRRPKTPYVLISRRRKNRQQNQIVTKLMNERRRTPPNFHLFETEIPEMAAIASALSQIDNWPIFGQKWKNGSAAILESLASEIREALHGARH